MMDAAAVMQMIDLIKQANKNKGHGKSIFIIQAHEISKNLTPLQLEELAHDAAQLTQDEFNILIAVGIPKQIYAKVLLMRQGKK